MIRSLILTACAGLAAGGTVLAPATAQADEQAKQLAAVLKKVAPSVVSLKMVGKVRGRERNFNFQGTVVSKSGLILCDDRYFSSGFMKVDIQSIKVIIGRDEETEIEAFHVATDTKLQLAYLQIEEVEKLEEGTLTPIDLKDDASAGIGQQVMCVTRFPKGYDFVPAFFTGRVSAKVKKPRKVWWVDGRIIDGMPVFSLEGKVLGVGAQVASGLSESGGGGSVFILPARPVRASLQQAEKRAVELAAERAKETRDAAKDDGDDGDEGEDGEGAKEDDDPKKDDDAGQSDGDGK